MPEDESERTGVLVIRAWMQPRERRLLARITGRLDLSGVEETSVTAAGAESASRVADRWLAAFERGEREWDAPPPSGG